MALDVDIYINSGCSLDLSNAVSRGNCGYFVIIELVGPRAERAKPPKATITDTIK